MFFLHKDKNHQHVHILGIKKKNVYADFITDDINKNNCQVYNSRSGFHHTIQKSDLRLIEELAKKVNIKINIISKLFTFLSLAGRVVVDKGKVGNNSLTNIKTNLQSNNTKY